MKYTIKNPLNSPYNVAGEDGQVHIPARDEVTADFTDMQIQVIRATGYFQVTDIDPLDHDHDGRKGGAVKAEPSETPAAETETPSDVSQPRPRGRPRKDA